MDHPEKILDAPLEPGANGTTGREYYGLNLADLVINGLLVALAAVPSVLGLVSRDGTSLLSLYVLPFLGLYQLLSATIGAVRGNKAKRTYSLFAWSYLLLIFIGYQLSELLPLGGDWLFFIFVLGVPSVGALIYLGIVYRTFRGE